MKELEYKMKNAKELKEKELKAADVEMKKCKANILLIKGRSVHLLTNQYPFVFVFLVVIYQS